MKFHLELAKNYWKNLLKPGDTVIDATVGNGHDTLFLAKLLKGEGKLSCYDIQQEAIQKTKEKLQLELSAKERSIISFHQSSHETFFEPFANLVVYNLGYLPGSNKTITTKLETTLKSLQSALSITHGAISLTCYPGHDEGFREEKALLEFLSSLPHLKWNVVSHKCLNRERAPSLIWITPRP